MAAKVAWQSFDYATHTVLAQIDPDAYAIAETSCDGNPSAIAEELEVTKQVIEDWRDLLHDGMLPFSRR